LAGPADEERFGGSTLAADVNLAFEQESHVRRGVALVKENGPGGLESLLAEGCKPLVFGVGEPIQLRYLPQGADGFLKVCGF